MLQMRQVRLDGGYPRPMTGRRPWCARTTVALAVLALQAGYPPVAGAAPKSWDGPYQMTTYASQKAGTSAATRQREGDFGGRFTLATHCSVRSCVTTVTDGPKPGNPTIPWPPRYTWNGSAWTTSYEWMWDCLLDGGGQKSWARATSWAFYEPQSNGALKGTWHTDIAEGPCRGSVVMPVAARPA